MISITDDFRRICSARQASQIRKGKRGKKRKHILKYLIFSKWLFYFTATSTVYCHNEMLWGYIRTNSSSSTFDIKRESSGEKGVRRHSRVTQLPAPSLCPSSEEPADNDGSQDWYQTVTAWNYELY